MIRSPRKCGLYSGFCSGHMDPRLMHEWCQLGARMTLNECGTVSSPCDRRLCLCHMSVICAPCSRNKEAPSMRQGGLGIKGASFRHVNATFWRPYGRDMNGPLCAQIVEGGSLCCSNRETTSIHRRLRFLDFNWHVKYSSLSVELRLIECWTFLGRKNGAYI